ncbi:MAG: hypothetical protein WCM76_05470 [Bacteroidota bacterium]
MKARVPVYMVMVLAGLMIVSACKKEKAPTAIDETINPVTPGYTHAGLGEYSGVPSGTFIILPENISIVGQIRGGMQKGNGTLVKGKPGGAPYMMFDEKDTYLPVGTGTYVNLFVTFKNNGASPAHFTLPAGLIFCDDTTGVGDTTSIPQHGFLLKNEIIDIAGGAEASFQLKTYCLNSHGTPSNYGIVYNFGPVTNYPGLVEIVSIMKSKQEPVGHEGEIQGIIWNVTNGNGLTAQDRATLNALP